MALAVLLLTSNLGQKGNSTPSYSASRMAACLLLKDAESQASIRPTENDFAF